MFNLLVKSRGWNDDHDTIRKDRVLNYTKAALKDLYQPEDELDDTALMKLPTLFMEEGRMPDQYPRTGKITSVQRRGSDYALQYTLDVPVAGLTNNFIEKQAIPLQVDDWEMGTTHWAVKNADLYKMLFEKLRPYELRSSVLDLSNLHEVDPQLVSVMMPFATEFDDVYRTLGMAATENKMECNRADDFWEHPQIMQDVVTLLKQSTIGCGWRS